MCPLKCSTKMFHQSLLTWNTYPSNPETLWHSIAAGRLVLIRMVRWMNGTKYIFVFNARVWFAFVKLKTLCKYNLVLPYWTTKILYYFENCRPGTRGGLDGNGMTNNDPSKAFHSLQSPSHQLVLYCKCIHSFSVALIVICEWTIER